MNTPMRIDRVSHWLDLCPFLGRPVPLLSPSYPSAPSLCLSSANQQRTVGERATFGGS